MKKRIPDLTLYDAPHIVLRECACWIAAGLNQSIKDTESRMKFSIKQTPGDQTEYTIEYIGQKVIFRICNKVLRYDTLEQIATEYIEPAMKHLINKHAESEWNIAYSELDAPAYAQQKWNKLHSPTEWDFAFQAQVCG